MDRSSASIAVSIAAIILSISSIILLLSNPLTPQAGLQGPAGPQGPIGPRGPPGEPGLAGTPGAVITGLATEVYRSSFGGVVSITVYNQFNTVAGTGSGFVFDKNGHVVTNNHVVEGGSSYVVNFLDGSAKRGTLVGRDSLGDIAVLKVELPDFAKPLKLALTGNLTVGEPVFAMGSPAGLVGSISAGVISQANRTGLSILPLIQTDAPINPGNSGGPLLNKDAEVVGINTIKLSGDGLGAGFEGLGFAIPASIAGRVIPSLISKGGYEHPFIGIQGLFLDPLQAELNNLPPQIQSGYLVRGVITGTGASASDLREGDVIVSLAGYSVRQTHDIPYIMESFLSPGEKVELEVLRNGQRLKIMVTLGTRPAEAA
jgi:S1-C subfamily serine protease